MKVGIITDTHLTDKTPPSRTDDLLATQMAYFDILVETAIEQEWELIAHAGDFFHRRRESDDVIEQLLPRLRKLKRAGITFVAVPGNHEAKGGVVTQNTNSSLNLLRIFGYVKVVTYGKPYETPGYVVYGYTHDSVATELFLAGEDETDLKARRKDDRVHIALVHYPIGEDKKVAKLGVEDLNIKSADLVAVGDIHAGFKMVTMPNGMQPKVVNVGAFSQMAYDERFNQPCIGVFDTSNRKFKRIKLPVDDVFVKSDSKKARAEVSEEIAEAFRAAGQFTDAESVTPEERLRKIARDRGSNERAVAIVRKGINGK